MKFSVLTVLAISAMASALPEPQASSSAIADAGAAQCPSACPGGTNIHGDVPCRHGACPGQQAPCHERACSGGRREVCGKDGLNCVIIGN